jgi:peptidoglycan/xylan/chitin deacetylase (PgdA/CDA1 family)
VREDFTARLAGSRHHLDRSSRCVALTFDDGPDPRFTPLVLDALGAADIRATFFFLGKHAARHPDIVQRAKAEGHAVGNHSDSHPRADAGIRALTEDYRRGRSSLESIVGAPVRLFRPPQGRITIGGALALRRLSLEVWLWTLDTRDWHVDSTTASITEKFERLQSGDVIVLHDGRAEDDPDVAVDRTETVAAIPVLCTVAREMGLSFQTL